jgi:hypothetical protein
MPRVVFSLPDLPVKFAIGGSGRTANEQERADVLTDCEAALRIRVYWRPLAVLKCTVIRRRTLDLKCLLSDDRDDLIS